MKLKRRDFLKMIGVAVMAPTALVKSKLPTHPVDILLDLGMPDGKVMQDMRKFCDEKAIIWRITAHKINPEVYSFYIPAPFKYCAIYKERFLRIRKIERTLLVNKVVFDVRNRQGMIPGDKFNLEIPDKDKSGVYQIFRIEEVIKNA